MSTTNDTTDHNPMTRPLAALLIAALAMHAAAEEAWHECDCTALGGDQECDHYLELCAQDAALDAARAHVIEAGEVRDWKVSLGSSGNTDTAYVQAENIDGALARVKARLSLADYVSPGESWVKLWFYCDLTHETAARIVWIGGQAN